MKVAICDSDKLSAAQLEEAAHDCFGKYQCDCDVFYTGKELHKYVQNGETYNIYLLEIQLKEMDTLELVNDIKHYDDNSVVIFVSKNREYMEVAFDVNAFHYITKPFNEERVQSVLLMAQNYLEKVHKVFYYKIHNFVHAIPAEYIYYLEKEERKIQLYMKDSSVKFYATLKNVRKGLDKSRFVQVNISDIVNVKYVRHYLVDKVVLENDIVLPITRHYSEDFKRVMKNYLNSIQL